MPLKGERERNNGRRLTKEPLLLYARRPTWRAATCIALLLGIGLVRVGVQAQDSIRAAPAVTTGLPSLSGTGWFNVDKPLTWERLRGRPVLVEFWATWCPPCVANIPSLCKLQDSYREQGLVVIGITNESPSRVETTLRRRKVNYAICAGQPETKNAFVQSIPFAMFVNPSGEVVWQGYPDDLENRVCTWMKSSAVRNAESLIVPEARTWEPVRRPSDVAAFDTPRLIELAEKLVAKADAVSPEDIEPLYEFYWRNLPRTGWNGDSSTRYESIRYACILTKALKSAGRSKAMECMRRECFRRITGPEPDSLNRSAIVTYLTKVTCERDDSDLIRLLESRLKAEPHPAVRYDIEETLERFDSRRNREAHERLAREGRRPSESTTIHDAAEYERVTRSKWTTRWFGPPAELRKYDAYCQTAARRVSGAPNAESVRAFLADYRTHGLSSVSDLLIRQRVLDTLGDSRLADQADPSVRRALQETVFEIVQMADLEYPLRNRAINLQMQVGYDSLDRDQVLFVLDRLIRSEQSGFPRSLLEIWKLQITDPAKLK